MNAFAKRSRSFSMNHADAEQSSLPTLSKVFGKQISNFIGAKGVEINFGRDGNFDRLIFAHGLSPSGLLLDCRVKPIAAKGVTTIVAILVLLGAIISTRLLSFL